MPTFYTNDIYTDGIINSKSVRAQMSRIYSDTTKVLDASSEHYVVLDGTGVNRLVVLPNSTTLSLGHTFYFVNDSTQIVPVNTADGTFYINVYPNTRTHVICKDTTSVTGGWIYEQSAALVESNFSFSGSYGGNAAVGRYLEIFPGISSDTGPYYVPGKCAVTSLTLGATATSTGTVGVFATSDLVNPITSISLSNSVSASSGKLYAVINNVSLALRVTSGSISKPFCSIYLANV